MKNQDIANKLYEFADLLESHGANPFRIRAYRRAAQSINRQTTNLMDMVKQGEDLTILRGVGNAIATQIKIILAEGQLQLTKKNHQPLISQRDVKTYQRKFKLYHAMQIIEVLMQNIRKIPNVIQAECTSDYRRKTEIVGNVDVLVLAEKLDNIISDFLKLEMVKEILQQQLKEVTVILHSGLRVRLKIITKKHWGTALIQHTGPKAHVESLQVLAKKYKTDLTGDSETRVYQKVKLPYIPPEIRSGSNEFFFAKQHQLPTLVELSDIKGDLHSHTTATDGTEPLVVMVNAAIAKGYEYLAITDHSQRLKITNGLDEKRLLQQIAEIDELNSQLKNFKILKSIEVDILEDGSLDLPSSILKELDLRVCSIHSKFRIPEQQQTERILRAMDNPYFNILGHATGRLINKREPYEIDLERILQAARDRNCFIEMNAQPSRLDIKDDYCFRAKSLGVKIAISSDAHSTREFNYMKLGVAYARRGWLQASDVINTLHWQDLKKLLRR